MKFFAYLALIGMGSANQIADFDQDLDGLQNLLDISISRWGGERIERKSRAVEDAQRSFERWTRGPTHMGPREDRAFWEKKQRDIFGFTFEEKYQEVNPEKRYMPLIHELMGTKEFNDYMAFSQTWKDDKYFQKIFHDVMTMEKDLTGYDRMNHRWGRHPSIGGDDYRIRPS